MAAHPIPILLLVRKLDQGGCERDLSRIALGLDRKQFAPHVGCFRKEGIRVEELNRAGVPILELPVKSFRSSGAARGALQLRRYVRDHSIQILHAFDVPTALYATPLARLFGVPGVIASQLSYRSLIAPHEARLLRLLSDRLVHRVHVNCKAMQKHMIEDEGIAADRPYLCYNGVDLEVFQPGPRAEMDGLKGAELIVGTIANLREEKALDILIRAFALARRPGMKLLIVGSGPTGEALEKLAEELGVRADCIFLAAKPDIAVEMRSLDIFVIPSLSEAFPNTLLEAMACGCAVIGSNVGGIPELILDRQTGLLARPGDAADLAEKINQFASDAVFRRQCAANGAQMAAQFSVPRAVNCMAELYQSVLRDG